MKNPNREKYINFQVNDILKKNSIEASIEGLEMLSKIIKNSIEFNKKLYEIGLLDGVSLAIKVEDLIEIFMLRSEVYKEMNYDSEFPEIIKGLNFDEYDEYSAIIYTKKDVITGTCRIIFDLVDKKLPIDEKFSLDYLRNKNKIFGELSRAIIKNRVGLKQEFKLLTIDSYRVFNAYNMDAVSVLTPEHLKLYQNFGGISIEKEFQGYGTIDKLFLIIFWNHSELSPFFKRVFLRNIE